MLQQKHKYLHTHDSFGDNMVLVPVKLPADFCAAPFSLESPKSLKSQRNVILAFQSEQSSFNRIGNTITTVKERDLNVTCLYILRPMNHTQDFKTVEPCYLRWLNRNSGHL